MSDTGTASSGMSAALQPCRKMNTTMITNVSAMPRVHLISRMPSDTARVVSSETAYAKSAGNRPLYSSMSFLTRLAASIALEPGN